MSFVPTIWRLYLQNRKLMLKVEKEKHTKELPRVRVKPSQLRQLHVEAGKRGYAKKLATYIRVMLFGGKLADEKGGMPMDDVLRNLADIGRARQYANGNPALTELLDQMAARHMAVINQNNASSQIIDQR